jgi:surface protein
MKLSMIILFCLYLLAGVGAQQPFITTWKTDNPGATDSNQILIPATGVDFNITWQEAGNPANAGNLIGNGNTLLTFPSPGIYTVSITPGAGSFHRISFAFVGDRHKILSVDQWGGISWSTMESAFSGCMYLQCTAADLPDLSSVSSMHGMFTNCSSLDGPANIGEWDVSNVTSMSNVFWGAMHFNQPIGNWNTENVTTMASMFSGASAFNQPIGNWNTGKVTSMRSMFFNATWFNHDIGSWNTGNITTFEQMFNGASSFNKSIGSWVTDNVTSMRAMFSNASAFNQDIGIWNTANVTNFEQMFTGAISFNASIGNWNTANVTNTRSMFFGAISFNQDIGNWNMEKVTTMRSMFQDAIAFNRDISDWNTGNVISMERMFQGALTFDKNIRNWNTEKVDNMSCMFCDASAFNQDIGIWNTGNVTNMSGIFRNATAFNQVLGKWSLHPQVSMAEMLDGCGMDCDRYSATLLGWSSQPSLPDSLVLGAAGRSFGSNIEEVRNELIQGKGWTISGDMASGAVCGHNPFVTTWKTDNPGTSDSNQILIPATGIDFSIAWQEAGNPANAGNLIGNGNTLLTFPSPGIYTVSIMPGAGTFQSIRFASTGDRQKILSVDQWGDISWSTMDRAFAGCTNFQCAATDLPDLTSVNSMHGMFSSCTSLDGPANIGEWDVSNVTTMSHTFNFATKFNQPIGNWNTENVTTMASMFSQARAFNQPIGNWSTGNVKHMQSMFHDSQTFNQPIGNWNTSKVMNMEAMFSGAINFNQPLNLWNTGQVENMSCMFIGASTFNQPLGDWNTAKVRDMSCMFALATSFNQPLTSWTTWNVRHMDAMFSGATKFNETLESWNLESVVSMSFMFYEATAFNHPSVKFWYLFHQIKNMQYMFSGATAFNQDISYWNLAYGLDMSYMFQKASAFNQDLGKWTIKPWANLEGMLDSSGMSCNNYSATLKGWSANPDMPDNLHLGAHGIQYGSNAEEARNQLIQDKGWTITGDEPFGTECDLSSLVTTSIPSESLQIWPNPATHELQFELPWSTRPLQATIFHVFGGEVQTGRINPGTHSMTISHLPPGSYILRLESGDQVWRAKFIKH